jgi:REP element-mobilizing transposase RayT
MNELPKRKPNRLKNYDYSQSGAYFVTICAKDREKIFGRIIVGADIIRPPINPPSNIRPQLTDIGIVVDDGIQNIGTIYPHVTVDCYVIMPNHVHMVIIINPELINPPSNIRPPINQPSVAAENIPPFTPRETDERIISARTKPISKIIGYFKQYVSRKIGFSPWQKSFHDHIIRNEFAYSRIVEYIENNPINWKKDRFSPREETE